MGLGKLRKRLGDLLTRIAAPAARVGRRVFPLERDRVISLLGDKRVLVPLAALIVGGIAFTPYLVRATSTPEFCGSCHVMEDQYEHWFYGGKHRLVSCVDCHLPNDTIVNHLVWKGIDGMKDVVYFYTRMTPEIIHSSSHARRTIRANCVRCHEEMVSRISIDAMQCWDCHRARYHQVVSQ